MAVIEHENGVLCMSTLLDIKFRSWVEQKTKRRRGSIKFREYIKRGQ